jgi:hypothetical protein
LLEPVPFSLQLRNNLLRIHIAPSESMLPANKIGCKFYQAEL